MQITPQANQIPGTKTGATGATNQKTTAAAKTDAKLKAACKDMEALFMNLLLTQMRQTVPKDGLIPDSSATDIMQSMLDTETTKTMAKGRGMGLGDMLYKQLARLEQGASTPKTTNTTKTAQITNTTNTMNTTKTGQTQK
jgi:flagellar protein FlgJ